MPRPPILLAFLAAAGCATTDRLCNPSEFVCWDAMSDARSSAAEACPAPAAVQLEGTEGTSPADYVCVAEPPAPPQPPLSL